MAVERPHSLHDGGPQYALGVSAYDRTSSLLIALLVLVGAAVVGLLIVFFSSRLVTLPPAIPVTPVAPTDSRAPAEGEMTDQLPGVENAPDALEPDLERLLEQVSLAATSEAVLMAESAASDTAALREGTSGSDSRGVGDTGADGLEDAQEPLREIRFKPESIEQYAAWFDAEGFELAVLGADNRVYYASNLSSPAPTVRSGDPAAEGRLYFNSTTGPLDPLDKQLAEKAGLLKHGSLLLQFCSPETQRELLDLERTASGGRDTAEIARTVFRVAPRGDGWAFEVEEQQFYR